MQAKINKTCTENGLCHAIFYRLSLHQLNSKNNGPGLLFQTIFCFLSSVSRNDKDVRGLKLSFDAIPAKIIREVFSLVLSDEICLIYIFFKAKGTFLCIGKSTK